MVIKFSQYVEHEDGFKPTFSRMSFGKGCRLSLFDFLLDVLPNFLSLLSRGIRNGCVSTFVDDGSGLCLKPSRSIRFIITLKF